MQVLRASTLPEGALAAAAEFYAEIVPPLQGRGTTAGGGGARAGSPDADSPRDSACAPPPSLRDGPAVAQGPRLRLPRAGEDLLIVFPPADHTHSGWRLAAVQQLARDLAPLRVNAVASADDAAIAAAARYLASAPGLTGQLLALDFAGAGPVVS